MLTSLESRRNKALRWIADYQDRFATRVQQASDRMIEGKAVVQLEIARPETGITWRPNGKSRQTDVTPARVLALARAPLKSGQAETPTAMASP